MGFTRKTSNNTGPSGYGQTPDYRIWPEPNVSYRHMAPRVDVAQDAAATAEITKESLLGTFVFLFILLLVGFIAGYSLRGNAYAGTGNNGLVSLVMTSIPAPTALEIDNSRSKLVASIGSEAPDELLAFESAANNSLSALVRLHSSGETDSDRVSLMRIAPDGSMDELLRQDAAGLRSIDMARLAGGEYVTATLHTDRLEMRGIDPNGDTIWTRQALTAESHNAAVKVVTMPFSMAIAGPSEASDRIGLTYLNENGELIWQRSFPADTEQPDLRLAPNRDGSIFLATRNRADIGRGTHTLLRIDREGQDVWRAALNIPEAASKIDLAATGDGGVLVLVASEVPTLTKYGQFGDALWTAPMPQAKFFHSIHLVATSEGNAVTAVSYPVAGERLYTVLEERNDMGQLIGESTLTLPGSTSIDAVTEASPGEYLFAGSIQPDRYGDSDIMIQKVPFQSAGVLPEPARLAAVNYSSVPETMTSIEPAPTQVVPPPATTSDTDLTLAAVPQELEAVTTMDTSPVNESSEAVSPRSMEPMVTAAVTSDPLRDQDEASNRAALSRFVTFSEVQSTAQISSQPGIQAQCRFSCLEEDNPLASFPMWRAIEAPQSAFGAGLTSIHTRTCESAGGLIDTSTAPDCHPY